MSRNDETHGELAAEQRLPLIDEHSQQIDAGIWAVWGALIGSLESSRGRRGRSSAATLLGCEQTRSNRLSLDQLGAVTPGFAVAEADPPVRLGLRGRHRFSSYRLEFELKANQAETTVLSASTRAAFRGPVGAVYRELVIGTRIHAVSITSTLRAVERRARSRQRIGARRGTGGARQAGSGTELEYTIEIERPVEEVFDVVADPRNDHRWCPRVDDCRQLTGNAPHVGARYELQHNPSLQRPHKRRIQIIELQRPYKVVSTQADKVARFTISYVLEPTQTGTQLTQRDEIDWNISLLSRPVGKRIVNRHIGEQLRSLKRLLERSGANAHQFRRTSTEGSSTHANL